MSDSTEAAPQFVVTYHSFAGDHRHEYTDQADLGELIKTLTEDGKTVVSVRPMQNATEKAEPPVLLPYVPHDVVLEEYTGPRAVQLDGLKKLDGVKARYDLIPQLAELEVAKCFTMGAEKYDADHEDVQNWMHPSRTHRMMYSAARRHLGSRMLGEKTDKQSGRQHLALAITDLFMILEADLRGWTDKDNIDPLCLKRPGV